MLPHLEDLIRGIVLAYTALIPGGDHNHDDNHGDGECDGVLAYAALIPGGDHDHGVDHGDGDCDGVLAYAAGIR